MEIYMCGENTRPARLVPNATNKIPTSSCATSRARSSPSPAGLTRPLPSLARTYISAFIEFVGTATVSLPPHSKDDHGVWAWGGGVFKNPAGKEHQSHLPTVIKGFDEYSVVQAVCSKFNVIALTSTTNILGPLSHFDELSIMWQVGHGEVLVGHDLRFFNTPTPKKKHLAQVGINIMSAQPLFKCRIFQVAAYRYLTHVQACRHVVNSHTGTQRWLFLLMGKSTSGRCQTPSTISKIRESLFLSKL